MVGRRLIGVLAPLRAWLSPDSLRARLLLLALLPILVVAPITAGFVVLWSHDHNAQALLRRVNTDLAVAHDAFVRRQADYLDQLRRVAASKSMVDAIAAGDAPRVREVLAAVRGISGFDFLHLTDVQGRRLFEGTPGEWGRDSVLRRGVARQGTADVGIEIYSAAELRAEDPELARRVVLPLIDTPRAAPSDRIAEDRAMVVRAVVPVRDARERQVALLDGGVIINRDASLVDRVRDLVYGPGSLLEGSIGTVTVFLDDVRISTNVPLEPGERALGTRVSREVRDRVLLEGRVWRDRAFVVNDWYVSAYEPIVDVDDRRVGMLYAGFLEAPYRAATARTVLVTLCLLGVGIALAGGLALWVARALARPIAAMAAVARQLRDGQDVRIGALEAGGELADLARQFDRTLDLLTLRNEEIRNAAERLELKVAERTRALRENNVRLQSTVSLLESTRRQLVASEKRAALGQLTAGVAHEINNPLAIIQGNLEVMRLELGEGVTPVETELDLALAQVSRMQSIVRQLLDYARSDEKRDTLAPIDVRAVVDDAVALVEHEAFTRGVDIRVLHGAATSVAIAPNELEQVLVNLLLNAVHFSPPSGTVQVHSAVTQEGLVQVAVEDQGPGVRAEHRKRVFDPFFTTRATGGTGLGLSVSYGIVHRHGGEIVVGSGELGGARFEVSLPVAASPAANETTTARAATSG